MMLFPEAKLSFKPAKNISQILKSSSKPPNKKFDETHQQVQITKNKLTDTTKQFQSTQNKLTEMTESIKQLKISQEKLTKSQEST